MELEFGNVGFFMEGGKPENPEKNPRSKDENQQQTQPTYDNGTGNRTRATLAEASALTTAPSLHPLFISTEKKTPEISTLIFMGQLWRGTFRDAYTEKTRRELVTKYLARNVSELDFSMFLKYFDYFV